MTGTFYGVGVGPGDPELLTLKARRILNEVAVIIAPESVAGKGSIAGDIIRGHLDDPDKILPLVFPMTYDRKQLNTAWQINVGRILSLLQESKDVAFITLGDPMLYSTCAYLARHLRVEHINIEIVPGVPAFCAAASRLQRVIAEERETVAIIPAAYQQPKLAELLDAADHVVVMKPSKGYPKLLAQLTAYGFLNNAVMVSHCGHAKEKIVEDLTDITSENIDYLSIILASKEKGVSCE